LGWLCVPDSAWSVFARCLYSVFVLKLMMILRILAIRFWTFRRRLGKARIDGRMARLMISSLLVMLLGCGTSSSESITNEQRAREVKTTQLSLRTADGRIVRGQVDCVECRDPKALIIMVHGSGGHDRRVRGASPEADQDGYFDILADLLVRSGHVVIRYDEQGFGCGESRQDGACVDEQEIKKASRRSRAEDLRVLHEEAERMSGSRGAPIVFLGFSEGLARVADGASFGLFDPKRVLSVGGPLTDVASVIRWQATDRLILAAKEFEKAKRLKFNHAAGLYNPYLVDLSRELGGLERLVIDPEKIEERRRQLRQAHDRLVDRLRAEPDRGIQFQEENAVVTNRFFIEAADDTAPTLSKFGDTRPCLYVIYGNLDHRVPLNDQLLAAANPHWEGRLRTAVVPGTGHLLDDHPDGGPLPKRAEDAILVGLDWVLRCNF